MSSGFGQEGGESGSETSAAIRKREAHFHNLISLVNGHKLPPKQVHDKILEALGITLEPTDREKAEAELEEALASRDQVQE